MLHNALQTSADILPIDVGAMVNKIFHYFHMYSVRVEELKEFCDFVVVEYKQILGNVKNRWFSLHPAITRGISMSSALKSHFLSQEECPTMLRKVFDDPVSLFLDLFLGKSDESLLHFHEADSKRQYFRQ
jgi:hypothetical protein